MQGLFARTTELWTLEPFVDEVGWGDIPRDKPLFAIPGNYNRPDVQAQFLIWLDRHAGDARLGGEASRHGRRSSIRRSATWRSAATHGTCCAIRRRGRSSSRSRWIRRASQWCAA